MDGGGGAGRRRRAPGRSQLGGRRQRPHGDGMAESLEPLGADESLVRHSFLSGSRRSHHAGFESHGGIYPGSRPVDRGRRPAAGAAAADGAGGAGDAGGHAGPGAARGGGGGGQMGGRVEGNVMSPSQFLTVRGQVMQSLHGFANIMEVTPESRVAGDGILFVNVGQLNGNIGRDLVLMSSMTDLRGSVGRNVLAGVDRLTLLSSARVGGDVKVYCKKKDALHVDPGATITGKTETVVAKPKESRFAQPKFYGQQALGIGIVFVVGWLLYWLFPALFTAGLG